MNAYNYFFYIYNIIYSLDMQLCICIFLSIVFFSPSIFIYLFIYSFIYMIFIFISTIDKTHRHFVCVHFIRLLALFVIFNGLYYYYTYMNRIRIDYLHVHNFIFIFIKCCCTLITTNCILRFIFCNTEITDLSLFL